MGTLPSKDTSEEWDELLANKDKVEHKDDNLDVELWREKLKQFSSREWKGTARHCGFRIV